MQNQNQIWPCMAMPFLLNFSQAEPWILGGAFPAECCVGLAAGQHGEPCSEDLAADGEGDLQAAGCWAKSVVVWWCWD